ncbi:MAG: cytochrome-c peroxidase, partial [Pseudomonadota bacterium]
YLIRVPGSSQSPLDDAELAVLLNWMVARFAPEASPMEFTEGEVTAHRRVRRMNDPAAVRAALLDKRESETESVSPEPLTTAQKESFGRLLFLDTSLSAGGNQSCASCHDPGRAFSDPAPSSGNFGASLGSDGVSLGRRNAPSLTYVGLTPALSVDDPPVNDPAATAADSIRGGFFWDGREATLEEQVLQPFITPREMSLRDPQELVSRVRENRKYAEYGVSDATDDEVLSRIAASLSAYLRSDALNRFDSRYDRYLRGEVTATREEVVGMGLFFSPAFTSCTECHQSESVDYAAGELFTNHRYANIGTPINESLLENNGLDTSFRDAGLAANPAARKAFDEEDPVRDALQGRFKVSSLRNVAVTAPYMHNGVFDELSTVLLFYNHFNESGTSGQVNPETGEPWGETGFPEGVQTDRLRSGFPLAPRQISALTAFLRMLTDQPYEKLLD